MGRAEDRLTEFCRERTGDALRGIFTYDETGGELVYARDDIAAAYENGGFDEIREAAWTVHRTLLDQDHHVRHIGTYRVTIHAFQEAYLIQFRDTADRGIAVVFDRDVGRNLHEFLLECENTLTEPAD